MRKRLSIAILALFILGVCTGLASAQNNGKGNSKGNWNKVSVRNINREYTDMHGEWSREAVMYATVLGAVEGCDGAFRPNQPLTHLEAIAMLVKAELGDDTEDYDITDTTIEFFQDEKLLKKIPEWGKIFVAAAYQEGIILPEELKKFNPQQGIKHYEVCIYLSRINGDTTVVPQTKKEFKDWADIPDEYRAIVQNVHNKGLVNGDQGKFFPNQIVKRCEMAVILGNLEDNVLHKFDDSKVKGSIAAITEDDGVYTISVDTGHKDLFVVDVDKDARVFLDGQEVDLDDFSNNELADMIDSQVKILINDDKAVLVRITSPTENEEDLKVIGTVEAFDIDEDNEDLPFTITVDTGNEDEDIEGDKDTKIYLNGEKIDVVDIDEDSVVNMHVTINVEEDKAVVIRLSEED